MRLLVTLGIIAALAAGLSAWPFQQLAEIPKLLGAVFIYVSGFINGIASKLLDVSMLAFVTHFDAFVYGLARDAISIVWTAFRDLGNIVIIGALVFIAISMILGLQSFGSRKLVARVLLIAILINFSFLFTRIVFNSTNFVATQFYCAMTVNLGPTSACGSNPTITLASFMADAGKVDGIGGQFTRFLGVPKALGDFNGARVLVDRVYGTGAADTKQGAFTLMYAILMSAILLVASLLFLFIAFLLLVRTILFLFLTAVSALAFAAYLVPKGEEYWKMWWKAVLQNAVFAPLLMLFLWATFVFATALTRGFNITV